MNRVEGKLAVTRAFGDFQFKNIKFNENLENNGSIVNATPEIRVHPLGNF